MAGRDQHVGRRSCFRCVLYTPVLGCTVLRVIICIFTLLYGCRFRDRVSERVSYVFYMLDSSLLFSLLKSICPFTW